jgi:hypothetical protein
MGLMPLNCRHFTFKSRLGHGCSSLVSVVYYQVKVSVLGSSLNQRSSTKCGESKCDHEALIMRRPWPLGAVVPWKKIMLILFDSRCKDTKF